MDTTTRAFLYKNVSFYLHPSTYTSGMLLELQLHDCILFDSLLNVTSLNVVDTLMSYAFFKIYVCKFKQHAYIM